MVEEFFANLMNNVCKALYDGLYSVANEQFQGMFESLNKNITDSAEYITQSPQEWNETAFKFVQSIAENVCIPIAGCVVLFVFCIELVHMMQENNQMHAVTPERIMMTLLKLCIFLIIASKSFDIVMVIYDIGSWAAERVNTEATGTLGAIDLEQILKKPDENAYNFGVVFSMFINLILIFAARIVVFALAVAIFIKVNLWYLKLLTYTSAAPIPMSTFLNREWGQIGNNYVRKVIAIGFEGFFMLIAFGLYSAFVTSLQFSTEDNFMMQLFMTIGCGIALFYTLNSSGNTSSSVFNAH